MNPHEINPEIAQIISDLRAEVQSLRTQLDEARKENERLKQIPELPPEAVKMLVRFAGAPTSINPHEAAQGLGLSKAKLDFCMDRLLKHQYVKVSSRMGSPLNFYTTAEGREYLVKAGLL